MFGAIYDKHIWNHRNNSLDLCASSIWAFPSKTVYWLLLHVGFWLQILDRESVLHLNISKSLWVKWVWLPEAEELRSLENFLRIHTSLSLSHAQQNNVCALFPPPAPLFVHLSLKCIWRMRLTRTWSKVVCCFLWFYLFSEFFSHSLRLFSPINVTPLV